MGQTFQVLAEGIGIEPIGLKERFAANILKLARLGVDSHISAIQQRLNN
jgi:hypothetical protein